MPIAAGEKAFLTQANYALSKIATARLTSVSFIMDYLIFGFDEKADLTLLIWPEIGKGSNDPDLKYGQAGYADRLCSLIEDVVVDASIDEQDVISIRMQGGTYLRVNLKSDDSGGERGILRAPDHFLFVF